MPRAATNKKMQVELNEMNTRQIKRLTKKTLRTNAQEVNIAVASYLLQKMMKEPK